MDFEYILTFISALILSAISQNATNQDVEILREYLQIDTSHPNPDYGSAVNWLSEQAKRLDLQFQQFDVYPDPRSNASLPVAILTYPGSKSELESILLYNHMDVVAVDPKGWTVDPFGGDVIENRIYGRGVQDMKSNGVEQLLAIRNLQAKGFKPVRTVHIGFFPDEERGGYRGINLFLNTPASKSLKVGFVLDEGMHNEQESLEVYYTQRKALWLKFIVPGTSGHGSLLLKNTAGEKLLKVLQKMLNLREQEAMRLQFDKTISLGDVTSINLNVIEGGIQENIIPPWLSVIFDIRVTPNWNLTEFKEFLNETCETAGMGVTFESLTELTWEPEASTDISNESWWWNAFKDGCGKTKEIIPKIFPAETDGRFFRNLGIPVLGMSTVFKSPNLLHSEDEYLDLDDFVQGIKIYEGIIESLALSNGDRGSEPSESSTSSTEKIPQMVHVTPGEKPNKQQKGEASIQKLSTLLSVLCIIISTLCGVYN